MDIIAPLFQAIDGFERNERKKKGFLIAIVVFASQVGGGGKSPECPIPARKDSIPFAIFSRKAMGFCISSPIAGPSG